MAELLVQCQLQRVVVGIDKGRLVSQRTKDERTGSIRLRIPETLRGRREHVKSVAVRIRRTDRIAELVTRRIQLIGVHQLVPQRSHIRSC